MCERISGVQLANWTVILGKRQTRAQSVARRFQFHLYALGALLANCVRVHSREKYAVFYLSIDDGDVRACLCVCANDVR